MSTDDITTAWFDEPPGAVDDLDWSRLQHAFDKATARPSSPVFYGMTPAERLPPSIVDAVKYAARPGRPLPVRDGETGRTCRSGQGQNDRKLLRCLRLQRASLGINGAARLAMSEHHRPAAERPVDLLAVGLDFADGRHRSAVFHWSDGSAKGGAL